MLKRDAGSGFFLNIGSIWLMIAIYCIKQCEGSPKGKLNNWLKGINAVYK